jgi:hypothetical protein
MIRFTCRCGQATEVDDDLAGGDVQCTACGLLNTVPTLSDLPGLADDGAYKIDDDAPTGAPTEERLRKLHRAFTRNTASDDGSTIDNRVTFDELAAAGDIPLADEANARPRYDPITGELIRPIELAPSQAPRADQIPMAKAAITYAAATPRPANLAGAITLLTSPGNLAVLGFMFLLHLAAQAIQVVMSVFYFVGIFALIFVFGIIGHFANVVEEIGPRDMDELPRPFRDLQIGEDLWMPFVHIFMTAAICFGPMFFVLRYTEMSGSQLLGVAGVLLCLGWVLLPAVLITTTTSGTILNLRPDRVWSVIRAGMGAYVGLVLLGIAATTIYLVSYDVSLGGIAMRGGAPWFMRPYLTYPALCLGIYLMHLFTWQCGLYYRAHHESFPWVYQRHVRKNNQEQADVRAARRAVRKMPSATGRAPSNTRNTADRW